MSLCIVLIGVFFSALFLNKEGRGKVEINTGIFCPPSHTYKCVKSIRMPDSDHADGNLAEMAEHCGAGNS